VREILYITVVDKDHNDVSFISRHRRPTPQRSCGPIRLNSNNQQRCRRHLGLAIPLGQPRIGSRRPWRCGHEQPRIERFHVRKVRCGSCESRAYRIFSPYDQSILRIWRQIFKEFRIAAERRSEYFVGVCSQSCGVSDVLTVCLIEKDQEMNFFNTDVFNVMRIGRGV
jgi:hypothetical protein